MKPIHDEIERAFDPTDTNETQLPNIYFVAVIAMTCFAVGMF